jgi:hypothetical protein
MGHRPQRMRIEVGGQPLRHDLIDELAVLLDRAGGRQLRCRPAHFAVHELAGDERGGVPPFFSNPDTVDCGQFRHALSDCGHQVDVGDAAAVIVGEKLCSRSSGRRGLEQLAFARTERVDGDERRERPHRGERSGGSRDGGTQLQVHDTVSLGESFAPDVGAVAGVPAATARANAR